MGVMFAMSPSTAMAGHLADTGLVNATVTPALVSVGLLPTSVAYPPVHTSDTNVLPDPLSFVATNLGNVSIDLDIKGGNSTTTGSTLWTIAGTAGNNIYKHTAASDSGFTTDVIVLTASNLAFKTGIAKLGTVSVFLKLDAPTIITSPEEQTLPVTITATAT